MKKILFPLGFAAILAATGCSEDFEVTAPYKPVAVVYGILDVQDTAHYIRIQKAFLDEKKSAVDMAKVADSNFFKDGEIEVTLIEMSGNNIVGEPIPFNRVNMDQEGYPKDASSGSFFTSPNYAYKMSKQKASYVLKPGATYNFKILNKSTGETIELVNKLGIVNNKQSANSGDFYVSDFQKADYFLNLERTQPVDANKFLLRGRNPSYGALMEGVVRFHYVDKNTVTGAQTDRSVDYLFASAPPAGNGSFSLETPNLNFYSFLADAIGAAPSNVERYLDSCDVFVWAGSNELFQYQNVNIAQKSGVSGDQIKPTYTNLKGNNVIGLLGSRTSAVYRNLPIGREAGANGVQKNYTLDSLMKNPITAPLNIKGMSDH